MNNNGSIQFLPQIIAGITGLIMAALGVYFKFRLDLAKLRLETEEKRGEIKEKAVATDLKADRAEVKADFMQANLEQVRRDQEASQKMFFGVIDKLTDVQTALAHEQRARMADRMEHTKELDRLRVEVNDALRVADEAKAATKACEEREKRLFRVLSANGIDTRTAMDDAFSPEVQAAIAEGDE